MTSKSIVIVDRSRSMGVALRQRLTESDDIVHVFGNFRSARELIGHKKIDAAFLEFDTDKETTAFCDEARSLGIPIVYAPPQIKAFDPHTYGFLASFPHLPGAPRLPIRYGSRA